MKYLKKCLKKKLQQKIIKVKRILHSALIKSMFSLFLATLNTMTTLKTVTRVEMAE